MYGVHSFVSGLSFTSTRDPIFFVPVAETSLAIIGRSIAKT